MPVSGDTARLEALMRKLGRVGDEAATAVLKSVAEEARALVVRGFAEGRSPTGAKWAPLKVRRGQPLRDTGRLQNSYTTKVAGRAMVVGTNTQYAPHHQFGTKRGLPARPMLPPAGALPVRWAGAFREAAEEALAALGEGLGE